MSSSDHNIRRIRPTAPRLALAALAALAAALAVTGLSGCQVRPLYATAGPGTVAVTDAMRAVRVEAIPVGESDNDRDRIRQQLHEELVSALQGGAGALPATTVLRFILTSQKAELGLEEFRDVPVANLVSITVSFTLSDAETGRTLLTGTGYGNASFDFSSQRFANIRAQRDAENRAAALVATDIRTRVAAALATR
ncbi:LPS assembly lipoprotein LptE [Methylobrevis albus]|uniref:LPS-assembly lipoprotein n=1 Tax=Methylobrevis albus TaxID=2793297 RepID=A0A931I2Q2_9HYPH|nr:LPS assembly lipoprotein LptE [Methylobrevis albus]MBH0237793.1 hypothetical protein [Methylobrevis albus]